MKTRQSGMPPEELWQTFFEPTSILKNLGLGTHVCDVLEFGCGYGTFTFPAAQMIRGKVFAIDIESELLAQTQAKSESAGIMNIEWMHRDFIDQGSGLNDEAVDYVMLFNILHAVERMVLLKEAWRVLRPTGKLAIIHWNFDNSTPRGPSMDIRPKPEQCRAWSEEAGFIATTSLKIDLPPFHYGWVFDRGPSNPSIRNASL